MLKTYQAPEYAYERCTPQRRPVVVIGAGPVGLTAALDLAKRGVPVLVLDDNNRVSLGSRAVCYAKRTLELLDRLGVGEALVEQGVKWQIGKVFHGEGLAYQFDLLPQPQHKQPAMINLQQYHLEEALVNACLREPLVALHWKHKLVGLTSKADGVELQVETPDATFTLEADWLIACDGAGSDTRRLLGLDFEGQVFHDRFLIADVVMKADFPTERWFWFDPPFHPGQSVLLHKQADNVYRIDFQLGRDADPAEEKKPERVIPRICAMLGPQAEFELEWVSVYQFACRRMKDFRHGRVLFAGDAAHQVSPFGARGANSGMQDADNLAWKLAAVIAGRAPESLLDSYHAERAAAADDNIGHSTRSTDFISPKSRSSLRLRNAVLELARTQPFARPLVNSGRLSMPTPYARSPLNTPDEDRFDGGPAPGSPCVDAPQDGGWLLTRLAEGFSLLSAGPVSSELPVVELDAVGRERYDARPGTCYLIRPDRVVAARWRRFDANKVHAALERALCR
ncbi:FAD-dependent oxidoreductase [Paucibacter sp. R3-3]|uniref:FAD-dependent oxidoreductase n=1 Tax=Roseateles agri TaxID=3098619 RepID=A0ABU5DDG1_9BURK|nr:FAD-dependent oxidoreductase [Paucibacter sp. R3-3]MDY0743790.1 FAD-dependent oxidoreductase [Paucibacter sp. R3-3]